MSPSLRIQLLKWSVAVLLAVMLVGGAALLYFGPVRSYAISCDKGRQISCAIQRETSSGLKSWQVPLGASATATVQVRTLRRGGPQVLLYLNSATQSVFAAEFEGGDAIADAQAAAARLNQVFSAAPPASVQIKVQPPSYMGPAVWFGFVVFALLVAIIYRELFKPERRPDDASTATPLPGAA